MPPSTWIDFRQMLAGKNIPDALSVAQRDSVEALICLFEFAREGSDLAFAMWPAFFERVVWCASYSETQDISHYLVTFVRWSQEIVVPWTRDLAVVSGAFVVNSCSY